jgi:RNA polymerase sigma-70 factor (ECF subfamily)
VSEPPDPRSERRRAFEAEALPHLPRVYAAARRFGRAGTEAEDLVQETFLRAYRTFDNFERGTNARAWLLTILHSIAANRRRRHSPEAWPDDELERRAAASAEVDWEAPQLAAATAGKWGAGETVGSALDRLPEGFRAAVLLVDLEGLTYEEAATALDCPIGTVRSRLARARRRLAAELADYARKLGLLRRT